MSEYDYLKFFLKFMVSLKKDGSKKHFNSFFFQLSAYNIIIFGFMYII